LNYSLVLLLVLTPLLFSKLGQFAYYFAGAIAVFGSTDIDISKIMYLAVIFILAVKAIVEIIVKNRANFEVRLLKNAMLVSLIFIFYCAFTGYQNQNSSLEIARALLPLAMYFFGLPLAIVSTYSVSFKSLRNLFILLGVIASFAVWFKWSQLRGVNSFGLARIALDADWMAFLGFIIIWNTRQKGKFQNLFDWISGLLITSFMFFSLTRTNIVLLICIVIISGFFSKNLVRYFQNVTSAVIATIVGLFTLLKFQQNNSIISSRISSSLGEIKFGGLSSNGVGRDASLVLRQNQKNLSLEIFSHNSMFGVGILPRNITLDTFFASIAQFGVIGLGIFGLLLYSQFKLTFKPTKNYLESASGLKSLFVLMIPASFIYNWPGNKSVWLALIGLEALNLAQHQNSTLKAAKSKFIDSSQ
jgi:hypothetical protein